MDRGICKEENMKLKVGGLFTVVVALAGCSTVFSGTAPAKDGWIYVVGSHNNRATVWMCPASGEGACKEVTVDLK